LGEEKDSKHKIIALWTVSSRSHGRTDWAHLGIGRWKYLGRMKGVKRNRRNDKTTWSGKTQSYP
jgi:hypothetical protein